MTSLIRSGIAAVALALPLSVFAGAIDQLRTFVESTQSGRATFDQQVTAKSGRKPQNASGTMAFRVRASSAGPMTSLTTSCWSATAKSCGCMTAT